jgi:hypothetical protein
MSVRAKQLTEMPSRDPEDTAHDSEQDLASHISIPRALHSYNMLLAYVELGVALGALLHSFLAGLVILNCCEAGRGTTGHCDGAEARGGAESGAADNGGHFDSD